MSIPFTAAEALENHVSLTVESIDRVYLNVIQPRLQAENGVAYFFRTHRGEAFATAKVMAEMTRPFVAAIEKFAEDQKLPLITFERRQRKETVAQEHLAKFPHREGILFVGKAQEKATVMRTVSRKNPDTGRTYPWLMKSTAMVNHYYFYCVDEDFGPLFIKFCSYFPYNAKLCFNAHEYAKRQLEKQGIAFEPLDNGILSCADPEKLQAICDGLSAAKIHALWQKWAKRLPHPFPAKDRAAGFRYALFLQQVEFARTQVFDRPRSGRVFFEQVLRDNLDLGRPDTLSLIFDKRIPRSTKTRYRTRLITAHVVPSLWLDYKHSSLKQYFKEGRALRTELTVNNTRDFGIGKALSNLPRLRKVAFTANRRLLHVQQLSHDPTLGDDEFQTLARPQVVAGQRASGLRFGDDTVLAVLSALLMFRHLPQGFSNRDLRHSVAHLLARQAQDLKPGQMTYQLRRLRLRGLISRQKGSHRYLVTQAGVRAALFYICTFSRVIRPMPAQLDDPERPRPILRRILQAVHSPTQPRHRSKT